MYIYFLEIFVGCLYVGGQTESIHQHIPHAS